MKKEPAKKSTKCSSNKPLDVEKMLKDYNINYEKTEKKTENSTVSFYEIDLMNMFN